MLVRTFGFAGIVAALAAGSTVVQADPATQETEPSVVAETLAQAPLAEYPGQALLQLRVTLDPGAVVPNHIHPGNLVFSVESGTISYEVLEGSVPVTWAGEGTPTADSSLTAGDGVVLEAGDWLFEPHGTLHVVRNPGDTPAVLLISAIAAADEPFLQLVEEDATPAP